MCWMAKLTFKVDGKEEKTLALAQLPGKINLHRTPAGQFVHPRLLTSLTEPSPSLHS